MCLTGTESPDQANRTSLSRWSLPAAPRHLCTSAPAVTPQRCTTTSSLCKKTDEGPMRAPSTGSLRALQTTCLQCDPECVVCAGPDLTPGLADMCPPSIAVFSLYRPYEPGFSPALSPSHHLSLRPPGEKIVGKLDKNRPSCLTSGSSLLSLRKVLPQPGSHTLSSLAHLSWVGKSSLSPPPWHQLPGPFYSSHTVLPSSGS